MGVGEKDEAAEEGNRLFLWGSGVKNVARGFGVCCRGIYTLIMFI
jgi:hypothetical protein